MAKDPKLSDKLDPKTAPGWFQKLAGEQPFDYKKKFGISAQAWYQQYTEAHPDATYADLQRNLVPNDPNGGVDSDLRAAVKAAKAKGTIVLVEGPDAKDLNGKSYVGSPGLKDFNAGTPPPSGQDWLVKQITVDSNGKVVTTTMGTAKLAAGMSGKDAVQFTSIVDAKSGQSIPVTLATADQQSNASAIMGKPYVQDASKPVTTPGGTAASGAQAPLPILGGTKFVTPPAAGGLPTDPATQALSAKYGSAITQAQGNATYAPPGAYQTGSGGTAYQSGVAGAMAGNEVLLGSQDKPVSNVFSGLADQATAPLEAALHPVAQTQNPDGSLTNAYTPSKMVRGADGQLHQVAPTAMTVDDQRKRLLTMSPAELKMAQTALFTGSYYGQSVSAKEIQWGVADAATQDAWNNLLRDTLSYNAAGVLKTPDDVLKERSGIGVANGMLDKLNAQQTPPTIDPRDAAAIADQAALQLYGRKASPDEQRMIIYAVNNSLKGQFDNQVAAAGSSGPVGGLQAANPSSIATDVLQQNNPQEAAQYGVTNSMNVLLKMLGPAVATGG